MSFRESLNFTHFPTGAIAGTGIKTGPGVLHTVTFNTVGATPGIVTLYDGLSASGTVLAVLTLVASSSPETFIYDVRFNVGLFIVSTATTMDITVSWE